MPTQTLPPVARDLLEVVRRASSLVDLAAEDDPRDRMDTAICLQALDTLAERVLRRELDRTMGDPRDPDADRPVTVPLSLVLDPEAETDPEPEGSDPAPSRGWIFGLLFCVVIWGLILFALARVLS